jgi:hypothetical protein
MPSAARAWPWLLFLALCLAIPLIGFLIRR